MLSVRRNELLLGYASWSRERVRTHFRSRGEPPSTCSRAQFNPSTSPTPLTWRQGSYVRWDLHSAPQLSPAPGQCASSGGSVGTTPPPAGPPPPPADLEGAKTALSQPPLTPPSAQTVLLTEVQMVTCCSFPSSDLSPLLEHLLCVGPGPDHRADTGEQDEPPRPWCGRTRLCGTRGYSAGRRALGPEGGPLCGAGVRVLVPDGGIDAVPAERSGESRR